MKTNIKDKLLGFMQLTNRWRDLAPDIVRQRLVIEGTLDTPFKPEDMTKYCNEISEVLNMTPISSPMCNHAPQYGGCTFMHWKESGMHIYSWDDRDPSFFSIDIYTCKEFDVDQAIEYTQDFFGNDLIDLVWKD